MDALPAYIEKSRERGKTDDEIKKSLVDGGWDERMVSDALGSHHTDPDLPTPPPAPKSNVSGTSPTTGWIAFEHILMFISLYVLATSIALLLHYFADKWYPGVRTSSYVSTSSLGLTLVRGYLAAAIVSLPMFSFFYLSTAKSISANPLVSQNHTRKILIYFTLIVTFIIMLSSIIGFVYQFLNGNFTLNFLLHIGITFGVSGIIFGYYLGQVKADRKMHG